MINKNIYMVILLLSLILSACSSSSTQVDTKNEVENNSQELSESELEAYNFKILEDYYKEKKYNYAFSRYNSYFDTFITKETKEKADEIYNNIIRDLINDESQHTLLKSLLTNNTFPYRTDTLTSELQDQIDKFLEEYGKIANENDNKEENETTIRIGMTSDEVLERWGKPNDINKTITKYGVDEQWVYPNYQYLYFEDGILTTIQQ